jgi:D-alanine-D-alanine ligase-like ATP-grasp enzyme
MGSSIGVSKATDEGAFRDAVREAFLYDTKILVETAIYGRELECAVLGNEHPQASAVGEIVMEKGFYDFEAKYVSAEKLNCISLHKTSANKPCRKSEQRPSKLTNVWDWKV